MIFRTIAALSNETVSVVKQSGSVSGGAEMMLQCSSSENECAKYADEMINIALTNDADQLKYKPKNAINSVAVCACADFHRKTV